MLRHIPSHILMVVTIYCARVCRRTTAKVNMLSKHNPKGLEKKLERKKEGKKVRKRRQRSMILVVSNIQMNKSRLKFYCLEGKEWNIQEVSNLFYTHLD